MTNNSLKKETNNSPLHKIMSSCYQVTGLVSLSYERPLTVKEQFLLKSHLAICAGCRGFYKNSQTLHKMMKAHKQHQKDTQKP